mgnify:CR=1 FL=1
MLALIVNIVLCGGIIAASLGFVFWIADALGVSTATLQPEWDGEKFVPRLIMPLSLTYDHRVIDGADGARFLRWVCEALDNPLQLVMKG